ncbi:neuropeptides B/W receptor type 2 isoform X1 [Nematostella vectensis]|uniref:neuropeptides B/W receptor type 2 isoform X1 n=1 Tax=Nematostella vectensis TaxID=45351 RepID=UPI0020770E74|nr:neuropeptides B/W receptor type 2 isoform X1 [Nematostella vectensis]XP_048582019.1 neuropeptides B/W receptor type 2 isoform X1 [Nematostella vectensis]
MVNISTHDNTTQHFHPLTQHEEPTASFYFRISSFSFMILAAIFGNLVVIKTIVAIPARKPLTYYLVTNLAVAELIGAVFLPMLVAYEELSDWVFGPAICHLASPGQIMCGLTVTWSLAAISVHRYRMIGVYRLQTPAPRMVHLFIGLVWVGAFIVTFPSLVFSKVVNSPLDEGTKWCVVLFPGESLETFPSKNYRMYILFRFILNFILPILTMVTAYGAIGVNIHMALKRGRQSKEEVSVELCMEDTPSSDRPISIPKLYVTPPEDEPGNVTQQRRDHTLLSRKWYQPCQRRETNIEGNQLEELEHDLLRMIYVIVLVFIICYFPYQLFFILEYFNVLSFGLWEYFHITRKYIFLITCLPSALHPLCYGTMSKFYAKAFFRIVLCKWFSKRGAGD